MAEPTNTGDAPRDVPRYATLRDYLHAVRRHRLLIGLVTVAFGVAAFLLSIAQNPDYEASSSLRFRDALEDFRLVAPGDPVPELPPAVRAAQNAELVDSPGISRRVQQRIDTDLTVSQLQDRVTARVGTLTNLVVIEANAGSAELATDIANGYAEEVRIKGTKEGRELIGTAVESLKRQLKSATRTPDPTAAFEISSLRTQISRLDTLRQIAEPVEIAEVAQEPDDPVSPKTDQNVGLGIVVGLFFGLIAAFMRDSLDRRLHTVREVHDEIALPILGRVPDTAFGKPGLAANGHQRISEMDFESFRMLRMNLAALGRDGSPVRSILVTSGLAEEGKSTVSMSLASAAVLGGQRVLLVECDLRKPSFSTRLGTKRSPGLTDFLTGTAGPKDILQTVPLGPPTRFDNGSLQQSREALGTLVCIAAGTPVANAAELLIGERFKHFLEQVTKAYDLVVFDSSPLLAVVDPLQLVPQVDGVLVCVRLQRATREEIRATRSALEHLADASIGVVATGLRRGGPDSADYYYYGD